MPRYYTGEPENDGKEISSEEFYKNAFPSLNFNPISDFNLLKAHRLKIYEKALECFKNERLLKNLVNDELTISLFYASWMKGEIIISDKWMLGRYDGQPENIILSLPTNSDKIELFKYKSFVSNEIARIEYGLNNEKTIDETRSFNWKGSELQLKNLYNGLKLDYLESNVTFIHFKDIFSNKLIAEINPIKWIGCKNHLPYLLTSLEDKKFLRRVDTEDIWSVQEKCILGVKKASAMIYLYKGNNKTDGKPRNHNRIDKILETL